MSLATVRKSRNPLTIQQAWFNANIAAGLEAPELEICCTIQDGTKAAEYISKFGNSGWNSGLEMTSAHSKHGRDGHYTPFDLLRMYEKDQFERAYADRFLEFIKAVKGKSQLRWSPGLRDELSMPPELSDEEIAARPDGPGPFIGSLGPKILTDINAYDDLSINKRRSVVAGLQNLGTEYGMGAIYRMARLIRLEMKKSTRQRFAELEKTDFLLPKRPERVLDQEKTISVSSKKLRL